MNKLRERFPDMYAITLDEIKEYYAGIHRVLTIWKNGRNKKRTKVYPFYYKALDLYMEAGKESDCVRVSF